MALWCRRQWGMNLGRTVFSPFSSPFCPTGNFGAVWPGTTVMCAFAASRAGINSCAWPSRSSHTGRACAISKPACVPGLGDAEHLDHCPNRQPTRGDDRRASALGLRHPRRYRERPAVNAADDVVDFVEKIVLPDHLQVLPTERVEAVVDRDLLGALLMGIMSLSCSNGSNSICASRPSAVPARTPCEARYGSPSPSTCLWPSSRRR